MTALIIEDDENYAEVLESRLKACGYDVVVTGSLVDAEKYIEQARELEVITLDLNLEDSTHDRTIPRIKQIREKNPDALLVVISGVITINDEKLVTQLGADGMIEKNDIPTERTFWGKLQDVVSALIRTPRDFQRKAAVLEGIAIKIARRCDLLGCTVGGKLTGDTASENVGGSGSGSVGEKAASAVD